MTRVNTAAGVLNPSLYAALKRHFGKVKISNLGMAKQCDYRRDVRTDRLRPVRLARGEAYCVNCPQCGDTKQRLYINHRWGVLDEVTGSRNLWDMICFNEEGRCFSNYRDRWALLEDLQDLPGTVPELPVKTGSPAPTVLRKMDWPGPCTPVHQLPMDHVAVEYLRSRKFNCRWLGQFYRVAFCEQSRYYLARQRLVAPIFFRGELVGYQTRLPAELDWKEHGLPKWWTAPGTPRARVTYNHDSACRFRTGVVVEGPGDVWGFGPMCHGVLGSTITGPQQKLLIAAHGKGSLAILLDPEVMAKADKMAVLEQQLKGKFRYGCAFIALPAKTDPGSLERGWARNFVWKESRAQGVKVAWQRW